MVWASHCDKHSNVAIFINIECKLMLIFSLILSLILNRLYHKRFYHNEQNLGLNPSLTYSKARVFDLNKVPIYQISVDANGLDNED